MSDIQKKTVTSKEISSSYNSSYKNSGSQREFFSNRDEISLHDLLNILKANKKFIALATLGFFLLAFTYALLKTPIYESSTLIQIENSSKGMSSMLSDGTGGLGDLSGLFSAPASPIQIEVALINSRFILQPTIEDLGLNTQIIPKYFPILGKIIANRHSEDKTLNKPLLGMNSYAWGNEKLGIKKFTVSKEFINKKILLKVTGKDSYSIYDSNKKLILTGKINKLATSASSNSDTESSTQIFVDEIQANIGCEFTLIPKSIDNIITQIQNNLTITDLGQQVKTGRSSGETGVLSLSLKGGNPEILPQILNKITYLDIKKNTAKKTAEAQKALSFLEKQSRYIKKELNFAEDNLSDYKMKQGSLGIDNASNVLLNQIVIIEKALAEIKIKKASMLQDFMPDHPFIKSIKEQEKTLREELKAIEKKIENLPQAEQKMLSLEREVKVKNELYSLMLSKIQQLQVIQAGTLSDVRILTQATSAKPLPKKTSVILLAGLMLGFFLSFVFVFIRRSLNHEMSDPDYIENYLNIPLYAVVPFSKNQSKIEKELKFNYNSHANKALYVINNKDLAIESIRGLRTMLSLEISKASNNIITILSANSNAGKSFISLNLSYVLANGGQRVLLVDADLRKGKLHKYISQKNTLGLSEILTGKTSFKQAKISLDNKNFINKGALDFVSCGNHPNNPTEILMGNNLEDFILQVSAKYDAVIIDTPPVLAVADSMIIAKHAGINLFIANTANDVLKTVDYAVNRIQKHELQVHGLVLNNTKPTEHYTKYGNYGYYYYTQNR